MKILLCFGTRPEAIKMAILIHTLKKQKDFKVVVCVTAQHREMLDQVLDFFELVPDYDLNLMQPNQTLNTLSAAILSKMDNVLKEVKPDLVLVHGDTTTSSIVALSAFHLGIKVGHVEAGLRSYNKRAPFPEEINRQFTSKIADIHFAPTKGAMQNLLDEGIQLNNIVHTGNTVIDALLWTIEKIKQKGFCNREIVLLKKMIPLDKKIILVTGHRRENYGLGFSNVCDSLLTIAKRDDVRIVYPVHLNPNVKGIVNEKLANQKNVYLISPVTYPAFVWLMMQSFLIVTDSGGIQEEAPTLGKPVLITRDISERPEGLDAGFSTIVGTNQLDIEKQIIHHLEEFNGFGNIQNPYGTGIASKVIVDFLLNTYR
ncbi:UDP-N-acetylglucosamine 2-epimerase (non-hydrolyzing) [Flavobacterium ovatum]|uniref:non-hydrolyzing UDP-N-acetylglucosamine 2-epimerase n=1 Tax=Flavobacterium ovatum TaxID=1928857 RepID=UPI00344D3FAD